MKKHPDKHIQQAIGYALSKGWVWVPAGHSAHCFCRLRCGHPEGEHRDHQMSVWSTPKNAQHHAMQIIRNVKHCL
ncbi:hypothetical protein M8013_14740 [Enterobacteriaceae bacterium H4N4]|uniref:Uncharacterized protein n=1 Tax=Silvania confinis TaxID=2926470 RepID=A0A9J6QL59_9ENTR|nr:hypothetical protein [Silvania confinis]MCU6670002.1 hypothetical protein [Silvania confinis]